MPEHPSAPELLQDPFEEPIGRGPGFMPLIPGDPGFVGVEPETRTLGPLPGTFPEPPGQQRGFGRTLVEAVQQGLGGLIQDPQVQAAYYQNLTRQAEQRRQGRAAKQLEYITSLLSDAFASGDPAQISKAITAATKLEGLEPEVAKALSQVSLSFSQQLGKIAGAREEKRSQSQIAAMAYSMFQEGKSKPEIGQRLAQANFDVAQIDNILKSLPEAPTVKLTDLPPEMRQGLFSAASLAGIPVNKLLEDYARGDPTAIGLVGQAAAGQLSKPIPISLKDLSEDQDRAIFGLAQGLGTTADAVLNAYNAGDPKAVQAVNQALSRPKIPVNAELAAKLGEAGAGQPGQARYVDEIKPEQWAAMRSYQEKRELQMRLQVQREMQLGRQNDQVRGLASNYRYRDTLDTVSPNTTFAQLDSLLDSGKLVAGLTTNQVNNIGQAAGAVNTIAQLKSLILRSPTVFPSVKEYGEVSTYVRVGWQRLKQLAGAGVVDKTLAELKSFRAKLVPIIKAFGDTGNVAVQEAHEAAEGIGLNPSSREAALVQVDSILRGLIAGVEARNVNPSWLTKARGMLSENQEVELPAALQKRMRGY